MTSDQVFDWIFKPKHAIAITFLVFKLGAQHPASWWWLVLILLSDLILTVVGLVLIAVSVGFIWLGTFCKDYLG